MVQLTEGFYESRNILMSNKRTPREEGLGEMQEEQGEGRRKSQYTIQNAADNRFKNEKGIAVQRGPQFRPTEEASMI